MKALWSSIIRWLGRSRTADRSLLVIDDDPDVRAAIVLVLEEHDFGPIWEAEDVETALQMAHLHQPRYIVTDRIFGPERHPAPIEFFERFLPSTWLVVFSGLEGQPEWAAAAIVKPDFAELVRTLDAIDHLATSSRKRFRS